MRKSDPSFHATPADLGIEEPTPLKHPILPDNLLQLNMLGHKGRRLQMAMEAIRDEAWVKADSLISDLLQDDPDNKAMLRLRALCALQLGKNHVAEQCLQRIARLSPSANIFAELGCFYDNQQRHNETIACLERAVKLGFKNAGIFAALANLCKKNDPYVGEYYLQQLAGVDPNHDLLKHEAAKRFAEQGEFEQAVQVLTQLRNSDPNSSFIVFNLGFYLNTAGKYEEAFEMVEFAFELLTKAGHKPDFNQSFNRETVRHSLKKHDFAVPQCLIEDEDKRRRESPHLCRGEEWDGVADLEGRHLVVYGDQGHGDSIQFVRFLPFLRDRGCASIALRVIPSLVGLFRDYVNQLSPALEVTIYPNHFPLEAYPGDTYVSLLNLPFRLGLKHSELPGRGGYFQADPNLVQQLAPVMSEGKHKIGIKWQGNPQQANDRLRSISFFEFLRLRDIEGVQLYSLHVDPGDKWLDAICERENVINLSPHLPCFRHTAAALECLDLLVSIDTGVAHLSGALGKPTWIAPPSNTDWRQPLRGEKSDWYDSARIFRQKVGEPWSSVLERITEALDQHLAKAV